MLDPTRQVVAFDLENTLIAIERRRELLVAGHPAPRHAPSGCATSLRTLSEAPGLLKLDRVDRTDFLRHFYRRYEDAPVEQIETDARELLTAADPDQGLPGRACAGCASTAPSATARS